MSEVPTLAQVVAEAMCAHHNGHVAPQLRCESDWLPMAKVAIAAVLDNIEADELAEAISDSIWVDWTYMDGARAIKRLFERFKEGLQ